MCKYMNLCTSVEEFVHTNLEFYSTPQNCAGKKATSWILHKQRSDTEVFGLGMTTWNILNKSDFLFPLYVTQVRAHEDISSQILKLRNYGMVTSLRLKPHFFHSNARIRRKELGDHSNWKSCNFRAIFSPCRQVLVPCWQKTAETETQVCAIICKTETQYSFLKEYLIS